ncbi:MAG: alpha-mannosidase [Opitutaceae bacterium]|jgi:alpha-mannosidase|nr:alpha-mannosidase [Opitutaceae bacterium]
MRTIHLICNAHIDPVWLWPWTAGLDEIINTCESVCNLLDRHPEVIFTRGESWVYERIEEIDPALFRRIRKHVKAGRWEIVGGWFVQPDCNLPGIYGLRKQIELGRDYFQRTFGQFPRIAYNVDSFGHSAALPGLMAEAGQNGYIMMRPQENEQKLPARLFRWRGYEDGPEITTFRIASAYCTPGGANIGHLERSLESIPPGITHTMCFVGIGDHGGGPTEEIVQWLHAHRDAIPGARLEFSSPSRFFKAVAREAGRLPLVTGELQKHAIGCYSVHRAIKEETSLCEHLLEQAEHALARDRSASRKVAAASKEALASALRWLCFNQFHDTLGGTCVPSAWRAARAQLGYAQTVAEDILAHTLRRAATALPACPHQRIVLNCPGTPFHDWIEHEPWLEWTRWQPDWTLVDEKGAEVPYQVLEAEGVTEGLVRLLFKLRLSPGHLRILRIASRSSGSGFGPDSGSGFGLGSGKKPVSGPAIAPIPEFISGAKAPTLELIKDDSDTWSHGLNSYEGPATATARWSRRLIPVDQGPLLHSWKRTGRIGRSELQSEWRHYTGEDFWELRLDVEWRESRQLLRLVWSPGGEIGWRDDGIAGGGLRREPDGTEFPLRDRSWLSVGRGGGKGAGVVCPGVYSISGNRRELRLTLLRSAIMAHHDPHNGRASRRVFSDQGHQHFVFRFFPISSRLVPEELDHHALALRRPPQVMDLTRGMPLRPCRGQATHAPLFG